MRLLMSEATLWWGSSRSQAGVKGSSNQYRYTGMPEYCVGTFPQESWHWSPGLQIEGTGLGGRWKGNLVLAHSGSVGKREQQSKEELKGGIWGIVLSPSRFRILGRYASCIPFQALHTEWCLGLLGFVLRWATSAKMKYGENGAYGARQTEVEFQLGYFPAMWPWTSYITSEGKVTSSGKLD